MPSKTYLHVDLDAFFASVEVLDNPELKGKPLIVGGLPGERRSVVSTCSYEARKFGVHSAMPINRAYELCPTAVFVHGRMERYHELSQKVMSIFYEFSPDVMQMSIDEAFIDITGTELLFGDPVTLAKTLKKKVFEQTGLTVSVGIASNRYVAKIASGLKKPDGLCYIPTGDEEKFMLSLPLDKLWGIGTKSRERLNACGIFTIPEIHAISETALKELFGEASGTFLYKSVRGMDVEHFGDETKSRSMSAERTFCFDLTDIYAIETELLHLSYDVMFRVLKSKVNSRTVCLKIRYEDFTTVTVTESGTRIVSSIEDLFERTCRLFHKKYERGRGIRLLGLGLQNVSDGLESSQGELFDFGEKRQRSVEKAVLKLHQKSPGTRLKKARQFITSSVAFLFMLLSFQAPLSAQTVEFEVEGSWESVLSSETTIVLGQASPVLSIKPPVFSQKADLNAWFMYDDHWYFDASVSTDSDRNVVAAGYEGDGIVRELRIGNDIGTDSMSPGIRVRLQSDKWDASARIHLDTTQVHSKTWQGSTELISSPVPLSSFKSGFLFAVPDQTAASCITGLFVEDTDGRWSDGSGRTYRRLSADEYLIMPVKGLIYLETPAKGAVIAAVSERTAIEEPLSSFLKDTADWFGSRSEESMYYMMGLSCADENAGPSSAETAPLFTSLNAGTDSLTGLYLLKPGTFSPFQVSSLYAVSVSENASFSISDTSLQASQTTSILPDDSETLIQLFSNDATSHAFSEAAVRFPAARTYPEIYLPSKGITGFTGPDITVMTTEHSEAFIIGSSAIESTIQVLKNGMPVPAIYDSTTGTVTLSSSYSGNDTITILWNEYSSQSENMLLTMSAVFHAAPTPFFTTAASINAGLSFDSATKKLSSSPETDPSVTASLEADWRRTFGNFTLSASNIVSAKALLPSDSQKTPLFTASGSGNEAVWLLDDAKESDEVPILTTRPSDSSAALPVLSENGKADSFAVESQKRRGTSGYVWKISGSLPRNSGSGKNWYAVDIPLSSGAAVLPSAHEFSLSMTDRKQSSSNYDVYLKLGSQTWLISSGSSSSGADVIKPFVLMDGDTQTVRIRLTDSDRMKLEAGTDMTLIIVNNDTSTDTEVSIELSGSSTALGGITYGLRTENESGFPSAIPVSITETSLPSPAPEGGWFQGNSTPKAACFSWKTTDAVTGDTIVIERNVPTVSLSRYRKASILLYVPDTITTDSLNINLMKLTESGYAASDTFSVTATELAASRNGWLTITKDIDTDDTISRIQIVLDACPSSGSGEAVIYIGGVFLFESETSVTVSDEASASVRWSRDELSAEIAANTTGKRTSAHASFSSPWLSVSGHGAFDIQKTRFLSGEYSASTGPSLLTGVISLSENYRLNRDTDNEYRKDSASLSLVPIHIPFIITANLEKNRTADLITAENSLSAESKYTAGETAITLSLKQKDASSVSFSYSGTPDAQRRTESASFTQKFYLFNNAFAPSIAVSFNNTKLADKVESTGSLIHTVTLPFTILSNRFSFSLARINSREYTPQTTVSSFTDDIHAYVFSFRHDPASLKEGNTCTTTGTISWARPLRADLFDLILPNSATVSAGRTISTAGKNVFDRKTGSIQLSFTAFNCFGSASSTGLFSWYDQDEFQYSVRLSEGTDGIKTDLSGYGTLYCEDDAEFTSFYSGSFSDNDTYTHTFQFSWNRPALLFEKNAHRITTGSFGMRKDKSIKDAVSNAGISHKAIIDISDIFSLTGAAGLSADIRNITTLTMTLSLGGKLQF